MIRTARLLLGFSLLTFVGRADTIYTVQLTTDDCTGGCLVAPHYPTVTLDDNGAGTVMLTEVLPSYMIFASTGAGYSLAFNLLVAPTSVSGLTAGFTYLGLGSYSADGTGTYTYAIDCNQVNAPPGCGTGTSAPQNPGPLSITFHGLSAADFVFTSSSKGNYFSSDVGSVLTGGTGNTGDVAGNLEQCTSGPDCGGGGGPQSLSPEPLTFWLTGVGLTALGFVRKRRRV